ncbi:DUF3168 domain-containing protein [Paraburkholderia nemoris]|uniref:DUF3168 domain-containing protein n=1 Tax=Paraburkholderia nemoris TaxID=2793076 RepID=UPI0038BD1C91
MADSIDTIVRTSLDPLVDERVFPDVAPPKTVRPYITYQGVGGQDETSFDGANEQQNSRVQVNVWADTRVECTAVMQQVRQALTAAPVLGTPIGAPVSGYEEDTHYYGSRLDFSIWFNV